ncbi:hypothetical protein CMI37_38635 [Candidatus Pacearchaeota archaeon]|jgi:hypothetical protein|nr:hypothetical protein [Candidatus Pacearchaeota archaeon]|tara:strand:+ start:1241 stop:2491 length:1251 start_codon:yes stop_codon:yes gene_type:complete
MESYGEIAGIKLDKWQKEVIEAKNSHIAIRAGRQVGKSTVISLKAALYSLENPKKNVLIIASVDRQAQLLFEKIVEMVLLLDKSQVGKGRDKPTRHYMKLKNGTKIYCLPTGRSGYGIRGYTIDLLIADEAAFIPEDVWVAVGPMLATTKGSLILLSTPYGKAGYFYDCFKDDRFRTWAVSSEECPRIDKVFLEKEKSRMTRIQYAQEYKGEFLEELTQMFPTELIERCMTINEGMFSPKYRYYLGVDIARFGGDETAFVVVNMMSKEDVRIEYVEASEKTGTNDTIERVIDLNNKYNFRKIFIDDGGLGAPIYDILKDRLKSKVIGINNASKSIDQDRKRRILKHDLYGNLLRLMEQDQIKMLKHVDLMRSLKSIQFEYTENENLRIFGRYSHIAEAAIRGAWCVRSAGLRLFVN